MALPTKGWPKHVGRGLRERGGYLLFLYNKAWKPLNIEGQSNKRRRQRWSRGGLQDTSLNPPLTRAAMTRRQIAWIMNYPEQRTFPCYEMYNIESDDEDMEDTRPPYVTDETEHSLSSSNQDMGVSVTISGHRFIALTKDTSWIDNCKACGRVDAVEFITRCGAQKLCSRQCVQMFVRHRRYRRQIQERPLFGRPQSCHGDARQREEEIVLEKPPRVKRKYTRRKPLKEASKKEKSNKSDVKPTKRPYVKKAHAHKSPKLKIKMQLSKTSSSTASDAPAGRDKDGSNERRNEVSKQSGDDFEEVTEEECVGSSSIPEQECAGTGSSLLPEKQVDKTEQTIQDGVHSKSGVTDERNIFKLGHMKIVLKKCKSEK